MKRILLLSLCLLLLVAGNTSATGLTVDEIVKKANIMAFYQGDDGRAAVSMVITDSQGRERKREFVILRWDKDDGGEQKMYVYFKRPADVRNMVFMVWKHPESDDDRWLYLPALDLVKRIAGSDKRTSFAGSHFLYEDVSGRSIYDDTHELLREDNKYYVIKNIPKDADIVEFGYYIVYIDKNTFMPMKIEFFDKNGQKYKIIEALETKDIDGYLTVVKSKATDLKSGGYTVAEFSSVRYNIGLKENIFTERYLRQPPRRWIRGR